MDDFFGSRPTTARRTTSRTLLSPEDAVTVYSRRQDSDQSIAERNALFYRQLQRHASQSTHTSSSFINSLDSIPKEKAELVQRRASAPPPMSKSNALLSLHSGARIQSGTARPPIDFKRLPQPVFESILEQLRRLHFGRLSSSCATCYMRDLVSLQLTCRAWDKGVRYQLYQKIAINGIDSPAQLKKLKMIRGTRLRLLRRTLRERGHLAAMVKELDVPDPKISLSLPDGKHNFEFDEYQNLVASLVMACPNLERLTGFYTFYNHEFNRLTHALSTRTKLKEHVWIIGENAEITARSHVQLPPGLIDQHQVYQFLEYHRPWSRLERLLMCSPGSTGVIEHDLFVQVFHLLPSLKHLCISSFDADDFTDQTLLALPYLNSLRLEECPGVTDMGLTRYAVIPAAERLESLVLIHQNLVDLLTISKVLTSLPRLTKFTIIQTDTTPLVSPDLLIFQPLLASSSLEQLHWDIAPTDMKDEDLQSLHPPSPIPASSTHAQRLRGQVPSATKTPLSLNSHLALSIQHSGFPRLKTLRAPQDTSPPGVLQAVCRPASNANLLLPADKYISRPISLSGPKQDRSTLPAGNSLRAARIRAQSYIESNTKSPQPFVQVVVTDHSNLDATEDATDSASSSNYSAGSIGTDLTDPMDLFSSPQAKLDDSGFDLRMPFSGSTTDSAQRKTPSRSSLRPPPLAPLRVQEFSFPAFLGRVATTTQTHVAQPPKFNLLPDLPGCDSNGGVVGWGDLLRISEKATDKVSGWIKDGCTGAWNKGATTGKGNEWWKHPERERRRDGAVVETRQFF